MNHDNFDNEKILDVIRYLMYWSGGGLNKSSMGIPKFCGMSNSELG